MSCPRYTHCILINQLYFLSLAPSMRLLLHKGLFSFFSLLNYMTESHRLLSFEHPMPKPIGNNIELL